MARVSIVEAGPGHASALARLAAATFPLACPPGSDPADIEQFMSTELSEASFTRKLHDPQWLCLVAACGGELVGYTLTGFGPHAKDRDAPPGDEDACMLSKCYVLPAWHGTPVAPELMSATMAAAAERGARSCWLGVNRGNLRAQRFYAKHGFAIAGTRVFQVGVQRHHDFVLRAELPAPPPASVRQVP